MRGMQGYPRVSSIHDTKSQNCKLLTLVGNLYLYISFLCGTASVDYQGITVLPAYEMRIYIQLLLSICKYFNTSHINGG